MQRIKITPQEYHSQLTFDPQKLPDLQAAGHISASAIVAAADPLSFLYGQPRKATAAMDYGNLLDCLLLTPELFDDLYAALPADAPQKPTKAMLEAKKPGADSIARQEWWANFDQCLRGRIPVSASLMDQARAAESMFRQHKLASTILAESETQVALAGPNPLGFPGQAKCLIDLVPGTFFGKGVVADFKSTNDTSEKGMTDTIWRFSYHVKMAWYGLCLEAAGSKPINRHVLIWQRSKFPYDVHVREISQGDIDVGINIIRKRFKEMQVMNPLDPSSLFDEKIKVLELAQWQRDHDPGVSEEDEEAVSE